MYRGERQGFFWLASTDHRLVDLVEKCPELFRGRSVVVTAFDSGPLAPARDERDAGWEQRGEVAITPRNLDPSEIPFDNFDEWYLFGGHVPDFGTFEVFVNWGGFSPTPPEAPSLQDPTWDQATARERVRDVEALQARFWDQLQRLQPSCYVADGDLLTVVTQSEAERNQIWDQLARVNDHNGTKR